MPSVLGTNLLAEAAGAITDFFEKLAGPDGTVWLDAFKRFLRKEQCWNNSEVAQHGSVIPEPNNFDTFFQTRPGLYCSNGFRSQIVSKAKPTDAGTIFKFGHILFTKNLSDEQIEAALPVFHLFDESGVCTIIRLMIANQWGGSEGKLLNNGDVNLLYTYDFVVRVYWRVGDRRWVVDTMWRHYGKRGIGNQVFYPTTGA